MRDDEKKEKHRYECRLLSDGSLWFCFQTDSKSKNDLPDYIVNEDALRFSRGDYVYDDGEEDLEEEKELRRQEIEQYLSEDKESCIAAFLREQVRRIDCQLPVSEASPEMIERYKPDGYSLLWGKTDGMISQSAI